MTKYVILQDGELIMKLGRFRKDVKNGQSFEEVYSPLKNEWENDNTLYSNLLDGVLQEITEAEAKQIINSKFGLQKQVA